MPKKPEPVRKPSDDCEVTIDGVDYHPHEGESIWIVPLSSVRELQVLRLWDDVRVKLDALEGEDEAQTRTLILMDDALTESLPFVANRIRRWDWTNIDGEPYPQPRDNAAVLSDLTLEELMYLVAAVRGETPGERGKDSSGSPITSSDTAPVLTTV